jgi:hypothetical protein
MTDLPQAAILSPAATQAVCRVAAETEPSAAAHLAQRPGALLTVLIHAARLGAEAAAPHIAAAIWRDVNQLMDDYRVPGRDLIAAMPFGASLDQVMIERYGATEPAP